MSETTGIHAAMVAVIRDLEAVGKDKQNETQGWRYRSIEAVINSLHPLFAKHGIYMMPELIDCKRDQRGKATETLSTYRWHFIAEDGSEITCTTHGEALSYSDKGAQAAHSYALKYALTTAFAIQTADMEDPDAHSIEPLGNSDSPEVTYSERKSRAKTSREDNLNELGEYLKFTKIPVADAIDFCVASHMIKDGEVLNDLSDKHLAAIVRRLSDFGDKIREFTNATAADEAKEAE